MVVEKNLESYYNDNYRCDIHYPYCFLSKEQKVRISRSYGFIFWEFKKDFRDFVSTVKVVFCLPG